MSRRRRIKEDDNLELWNKVSKTNPFFTKEDKSRGKTMTSINPQYQLKKATQVLGIFGSENFRVENPNWKIIDIDEFTKLALYTATLRIKYNEKEIVIPFESSGEVCYKTKGDNGYLKVEKEFAKKISTDALTKVLSKLGFNADVFLGFFDDSKYIKFIKEYYGSSKEDLMEMYDDEM